MSLRPGLRLIALLALGLARPAAASVSFLGDWSDFGAQFQQGGPQTRLLEGQPVEWVAGYGPNHWRIVQEKGLDRLRVERDPTSPRGAAVLRVEVRPGDNVGWTGERSEVSHMLDASGQRFGVTADSGHEFYALALKVAADWRPPQREGAWRWGLVLQLHSPDDFEAPPALALAVEDDIHLQRCTGDLVEGGRTHNKDAETLPLARPDLRAGHWVELLMDVVWATDRRGSLSLYRRDEGEREFTLVLERPNEATLQYRSTTPTPRGIHYWKMGYYRSRSPDVISQLWLGPLVRGTTRAEVLRAAFDRDEAR